MDFDMEHILGSLMETGYDDLFDSLQARKTLKAFDDSAIALLCRKCDLAQKYK